MELSKQVTSLELSKRLKELEIKQKSLWYWIEYKKGDWELYLKGTESFNFWRNKSRLSAFTVAELGEMLKETRPELDNPFPSYGLITKRWFLLTEDGNIEAKTEANARAKTIIYLKGI